MPNSTDLSAVGMWEGSLLSNSAPTFCKIVASEPLPTMLGDLTLNGLCDNGLSFLQ